MFPQEKQAGAGAQQQSIGWLRSLPAWVRFVGHVALMVAAMYLGMLALDPVYELAASAMGTRNPWLEWPMASAVVMWFNMSAPMVVLMRVGPHRQPWRLIAEMCLAMGVPGAAAMALHAVLRLSPEAMMTVGHLGMIPAMVAAMALRYREYSGVRPASPGSLVRR
jgi:flagellar biosynthetic protein FliP